MPKSLRNVAWLHCAALAVLLASAVGTAGLPWLALLAVVALAPLGPMLFIDRPLMWQMAKWAAYGFAFICGIWLMYGVFGIRKLADVPALLLYFLLAFYFVGVGGFLKSTPIRRYFRLPESASQAS